MSFAVLLFSGFLAWQAPATLVDGRCSVCAAYGAESVVYVDPTLSCTAMLCMPSYYDERGVYVKSKPCNTCRRGGRCSNGHSIALVPDVLESAPFGIPIGAVFSGVVDLKAR